MEVALLDVGWDLEGVEGWLGGWIVIIWNCKIVIIRSVFVIEQSVLSAVPEFIHEFL